MLALVRFQKTEIKINLTRRHTWKGVGEWQDPCDVCVTKRKPKLWKRRLFNKIWLSVKIIEQNLLKYSF